MFSAEIIEVTILKAFVLKLLFNLINLKLNVLGFSSLFMHYGFNTLKFVLILLFLFMEFLELFFIIETTLTFSHCSTCFCIYSINIFIHSSLLLRCPTSSTVNPISFRFDICCVSICLENRDLLGFLLLRFNLHFNVSCLILFKKKSFCDVGYLRISCQVKLSLSYKLFVRQSLVQLQFWLFKFLLKNNYTGFETNSLVSSLNSRTVFI